MKITLSSVDGKYLYIFEWPLIYLKEQCIIKFFLKIAIEPISLCGGKASICPSMVQKNYYSSDQILVKLAHSDNRMGFR